MGETEPLAAKADEPAPLRFRMTQSTLDDLTCLAILDETTLAAQAHHAVSDYLQDPAEIEEPIESRRLIRKAEMLTSPEAIDKLGALAIAPYVQVDQVLHEAFTRYVTTRLDGMSNENPTEGAGIK